MIGASTFHTKNKETLNSSTDEKSQMQYNKIISLQDVTNYENRTIHKRFIFTENKHNIIINNVQYHKSVLITTCILLIFGIAVFCIRMCCKYKIDQEGKKKEINYCLNI